MQSNPYLFFNGECETAFKFYEQCLGGKIVAKMTYGESPMAEQAPPEQRDRVGAYQFNRGRHSYHGCRRSRADV
jgi:uncharacterized glyoxalase superfamily protein PhnB